MQRQGSGNSYGNGEDGGLQVSSSKTEDERCEKWTAVMLRIYWDDGQRRRIGINLLIRGTKVEQQRRRTMLT
jgi:hypothetical protein